MKKTLQVVPNIKVVNEISYLDGHILLLVEIFPINKTKNTMAGTEITTKVAPSTQEQNTSGSVEINAFDKIYYQDDHIFLLVTIFTINKTTMNTIKTEIKTQAGSVTYEQTTSAGSV